ncbi:SARP family transcriptional regulator [Actinoplanes sp. N902-109]|uniref:NACHT and WD40 repeat domain-containing protein n=1 Tax=Actinoplanes sp. (strain N902-109) TaxID=649831 RepID=UPI0003293799|nr:SARP family transcriptional regulator [Actinoplanes sp. N902-109]AGL17357.1 SARP family transcriptional regulator [Actinoplanes sp. N902-109]
MGLGWVRRQARRLVLGVCVAAGLGWTLNELFGWLPITDDALGRVADAAGVAGLVISVVALLWPSGELAEAAPASLHAAAGDLADKVRAQWLDEGALALRESGVLPLSWSPTTLDAADRDAVRVRGGRFDGDLDQAAGQLAAGYRTIPHGRLLVLGEPGAGKTVVAVLLTLGLLAGRRPGDRVPMLLSLSSWNPTEVTFKEWMTGSIAAANYAGNRRVARRLLAADLILPILDGLDELPESTRRVAVDAVNAATGADRPVVVTCRVSEFMDVVSTGGPALRRAALVQVDRVAVADVSGYLGRGEDAGPARWQPVIDAMRADPGGPLGTAFGSPLMVSVAKAAYRDGTRDPAELVAFASRHDVENHLVDCLLDVAYPPERGGARQQRWLTFLAVHLDRQRDRQREIAWWNLLPAAGPGGVLAVGVASGLLATVLGAGYALRHSFSAAGLNGAAPYLVALAFLGMMGANLTLSTRGQPPGRLAFASRGWGPRVRRSFVAGASLPVLGAAVAAVIWPLVIGLSPLEWSVPAMEYYAVTVGTLLGTGVALGCGTAVHSWLISPREDARRADPMALLRDDRRSSLVACLLGGAVAGAALIPFIESGVTLLAGLGTGAAAWSQHRNPFTLARDLTGPRAQGPPFSLLAAVVHQPWPVFAGTFVLLGAGLLLTRAWPRFVLARLVLAVRRRLPFALLSFLAEARDRGLLRRAGGAYQFRHLRLQQRLVARAAPDRREAAAGAGQDRAAARLRGRRAVVAAVVGGTALAVLLSAAMTPGDAARRVLSGHGIRITAVGFAEPGFTVTGAGPGGVRLWNTQDAGPYARVDRAPAGDAGPDSAAEPGVAVSADGMTTAVLTTTGVSVQHTVTHQHRALVRGATRLLGLSRDGATVVTDRGVSDARTSALRASFDPLRGAPLAKFSPDGRVVAAFTPVDERLLVVPVSPGVAARTLRIGEDPVDAVAFAPDRPLLAVAAGAVVRVWDYTSGAVVASMAVQRGVLGLDFDAGGTRLAAQSPDRAGVYDVGTGRQLSGITGDRLAGLPDGFHGILDARLAPDGTILAVLSIADRLTLLDAATATVLAAPRAPAEHCRFDPAGRLLATWAGAEIDLWEAATGQRVARLRGHAGRVNDVAFSADGRRLVSGSDDGTARVWDVP